MSIYLSTYRDTYICIYIYKYLYMSMYEHNLDAHTWLKRKIVTIRNEIKK